MDRIDDIERTSSSGGKKDHEISSTHLGDEPGKKLPLRKRIASVIWDSLDKSPEERRFIAKIDFWILSYCTISYWGKYMCQQNVTNAYVSGMKEDLNMSGNDLNLLTTYWNIGYIIGQIPSQLILTKVRPSIWLPSLELAWSFVVMGMAGGKNVSTMYALRFVSGVFEASAYPGIMTLLGNWYTPAELGKRASIFQASSSAAQMFSGYLQAALYAGMNGRGGLAAWKWLFIFDGIIGVPIGIYGYWAIPDQPTTSKAWWLKTTDREMAIARMERVGRKPMKRLTWKIVRSIFTAWPLYLFCAIFICHVLGIRIYSYMNLWLKATKLYTTEEVNIIPTAGYGLQILFTVMYAWTSDATGLRWPSIIVACLVAMIGTIILSVYPEHNIPAMMAGWLLTFCETGAGALIITWINEICSHSAEHRAIIIGMVETAAYTFQAWVPLFVYDTSEAPHFRIGYQMATMFFALEIVLALVILWLSKKRPVVAEEDLGQEHVGTEPPAATTTSARSITLRPAVCSELEHSTVARTAVIVGGSLAGLMHGILLKRRGVDVVMIEQDPSTERIGNEAAIGFSESVVEFLRKFDATGVPLAIDCQASKFAWRKNQDTWVAKGMRSLSNWSLMYRVLRANFDGMSSSACPRPPDPLPGDGRVEYRVGYKATDLALMEDRVRLSFVDNVNQKYGSIEADMVIGADGLHSTVRRLVGASTPEQYSGYITWRGTVPEAQVTRATASYFRDTVGLNFTPGSYAVVYPIPTDDGKINHGERLLNIAVYYNVEDGSREMKEIFTDSNGRYHRNAVPQGFVRGEVLNPILQAISTRMAPPFAELVAQVKNPFITKIIDSLGTAASFYNGRVLLVGDALSTARPHIAKATEQAAFHCLLLEKLLDGAMTQKAWDSQVATYAEQTWLISNILGVFGQGSTMHFLRCVLA